MVPVRYERSNPTVDLDAVFRRYEGDVEDTDRPEVEEGQETVANVKVCVEVSHSL